MKQALWNIVTGFIGAAVIVALMVAISEAYQTWEWWQ